MAATEPPQQEQDTMTFLSVIRHASSLPHLLTLLRSLTPRELRNVDFSGLPTFGGPEPTDTVGVGVGVWSWDETHLLVGDGSVSEWEIVPRED